MRRLWLLIFALLLDPLAAHAAQELDVSEIAPGVFVHGGVVGEINVANYRAGGLANIGFIVGERCVAVIDSGGSFKIGQMLHAAIKARSNLPICYVILSHAHLDHVFGSAAFVADKPEFVGHSRLRSSLGARARTYLDFLRHTLAEDAAGIEIVMPTLVVRDSQMLDLGGRTLAVRAWKTGHTDADLSVWDDKTKTLWLSDLLFVDHIPALDGSIAGWLEVMAELKRYDPQFVVPGHGRFPAAWPAALEAQERYLRRVAEGVRSAIKARKTIQEAVDSVAYDEMRNWQEAENFHRRNVTSAFAELEWED